jgi:hypothetical protein
MSNSFNNNNNFNSNNYDNSGYSAPNYGAFGAPMYPSIPAQQNNIPPYINQSPYGYPSYSNTNITSYPNQNMSNSNVPGYFNPNMHNFQDFNNYNNNSSFSTNSMFDPLIQNQTPMPPVNMPYGILDPHHNNNPPNYPSSYQNLPNPSQTNDIYTQSNENTHKPIEIPVSFNNSRDTNNNAYNSSLPNMSFMFDPLSVLLDNYSQNKDSIIKDIQSNHPANIEINQKRDAESDLNPNILFSLGNFHVRFKDAFQTLIKVPFGFF